tara:strand:+ start:10119 stop:10268 length:150 start_codon:yes stop_codon:yes gene_type:complete
MQKMKNSLRKSVRILTQRLHLSTVKEQLLVTLSTLLQQIAKETPALAGC